MAKSKLTKLIDEAAEREPDVVINPTTDGNQDLRDLMEDLKDLDFDHGDNGLITGLRYRKINKRIFQLTRRDPFGFWTVELYPSGKVHKGFEGEYTSVEKAEVAAAVWSNNN